MRRGRPPRLTRRGHHLALVPLGQRYPLGHNEVDRRCGTHGKRAHPLQESADDDVTEARFACR
jgi:hypothetical protein